MIPNYKVHATFYVAADNPEDASNVVEGLDASSIASVQINDVAEHPEQLPPDPLEDLWKRSQ